MTTDMKSVHIRIVDTGIGIKAKFAPRLFEPFTKSDSFSPGAGLGLYITKGLVDRMSGTLSLSPNEHGGTTFESILPIELLGKKEKRPEIVTNHVKGWMTEDGDAKELAGPGPSPSNPSAGETTDPDRSVDEVEVSAEPPATTDRRPQVRVLVADDNEISRKLLLMALKRSPTKVVAAQAANGQEALEKFREFQPDLFLTDVSMPVMDGLTAAGRMRQLEKESGSPRCRIYAITGLGNSDPRLQKDSLRGEATLDGWLVKGEHGLEVIYDIVKDTLNRKRGE
jgi:CheY-like chemotaxis protein